MPGPSVQRLGPERRIGQRWEPTRAPTQGPRRNGATGRRPLIPEWHHAINPPSCLAATESHFGYAIRNPFWWSSFRGALHDSSPFRPAAGGAVPVVSTSCLSIWLRRLQDMGGSRSRRTKIRTCPDIDTMPNSPAGTLEQSRQISCVQPENPAERTPLLDAEDSARSRHTEAARKRARVGAAPSETPLIEEAADCGDMPRSKL